MLTTGLFELLPGFAVNCLNAFFIARYVYRYSSPKNQDFRVALLSFSAVVYLVVSMLRFLELNSGMGFGLLAVFATMNIRSINLPVKEMTYLFIAITLAMFNSLFTNTGFTLLDRILINLLVLFVLYLVEQVWGAAYEPRQALLYEKVELVKPEKYQELIDDVRVRTGLDITRIEVSNLDFVRDTAELQIFYQPSPSTQTITYPVTNQPLASSASATAQTPA